MPARTSEPSRASTTTAVASRAHRLRRPAPDSSTTYRTARRLPAKPTASRNQNSGAASSGPPCGKNWRSISSR
ncbi:hypothetical protein [Kitasatospora phosalacinea]|uniref:hypothetical protein n=1 Tax=Kitasatospora phosalacinea TaxID=2065 RepID=UPI00255677D3|nr:hypothetical protein [Kitasatospora phosalacinea]